MTAGVRIKPMRLSPFSLAVFTLAPDRLAFILTVARVRKKIPLFCSLRFTQSRSSGASILGWPGVSAHAHYGAVRH